MIEQSPNKQLLPDRRRMAMRRQGSLNGGWDAQLAYWQQKLSNAPEPLRLPPNRPRLAPCLRGATQSLDLPPSLVMALTDLADEEKSPLFMVLFAALQVLLYRYTGQTDLIVGSPIAEHPRAEQGPFTGFLANILPLRTDLSGNPTFRHLLQTARQTTLAAYTNQDVLLATLIDVLDLPQVAGNSLLVVFKNADRVIETPDLCPEEFAFDSALTATDLTVEIVATSGVLTVKFAYSLDLFDSDTIARMMAHFQTLLNGIGANPDQSIGELPLLTESECHQLLVAWNDTQTPYPRERTIHQLFEKQAERTPNAIALLFQDSQLTYQELNRHANQLAHYLQTLGIGTMARETPLVGIYMEHSPEMVIGILAILKAGGAYLPLDPTYPQERLAFMLADVQPPVVLTQAHLSGRLPPAAAQIVCVDMIRNRLGHERDDNPMGTGTGEQPAYVMYTSGSTGRPKGIAIPHRAISRLVLNTNYIELGPTDCVALLSNSAFDAATFELWGALLQGARLVGLNPKIALSPADLVTQIRAFGINTLFLTTALFTRIAYEQPNAFSTLRTLLFGGETVDPQAVRQVLRAQPPERLLHVYGPTESTTFATWQLVEEVPADAHTVPIGRPLANTQTYILDRFMQPTPVGVTGELYIGGDGLALGYLNRPDLTAEKFVTDPFRANPNARLYRTGDFARYLSNGAIEFLGRSDHQVKLRGFRIELGEIEATLAQSKLVDQAVVLLQGEGENKRLFAYVVPSTTRAENDDVTAEAQVSQWQGVYEKIIYRDLRQTAVDPYFNMTGWKSTYTDEAFHLTAMREQVAQTVNRALDGKHERIVEIGCGTGMLLFALAAHCREYVATDFSPAALDYLRQHLPNASPGSAEVRLLQCAADNDEAIAKNHFDLVILNSVVQYFPHLDYLKRVLQGAVALLVDGGRVIIGDVRSLPLHEVFVTSVALFQASPKLTVGQLRRHIQRALQEEQELLIDPRYFAALPATLAGVSEVEVLLKRGHDMNELTKYRYDVIIHVAASPPQSLPVEWVAWEESRWSLDQIRHALQKRPARLAIRRIPNGRLVTDLCVMRVLAQAPDEALVSDLMAQAGSEASGVDPESLWQLGDELSYTVTIGWSASAPSGSGDTSRDPAAELGALLEGTGSYDVLFQLDEDGTAPGPRIPLPLAAGQPSLPSRERLASHPLRGAGQRNLVARLRRHLEERLPSYMIPAAIVPLNALPLNPNGKVDRSALSALESNANENEMAYVAPQSPTERCVARLFAQMFGLDRVGRSADFFELGGDSILAMKLVNQLQGDSDIALHPTALFDAPTVAALSQYLDQHYPSLVGPPEDVGRSSQGQGSVVTAKLTAAHVAHLRGLLPLVSHLPHNAAGKNKPALFLLAPPRSGSSLLRIMLAGHPSLFAPPELELLSFDTLQQRRAVCSGRYSFMREGCIRALIELAHCSADSAIELMDAFEARNLATKEFYYIMQEWIGERMLVDKTTTYGQDVAVLQRAEVNFNQPKYIRLLRHPCAVIHSFETARLDRVLRYRHPFSPREFGELLWCLIYENISTFLGQIPPHRQYDVRFEDLVRNPTQVMAGVCDFLGIEFHPNVVDPYRQLERRMIDGLYPISKPISDTKFFGYEKIESHVAERWLGHLDPNSIGEMTRTIAASLGYAIPAQTSVEVKA